MIEINLQSEGKYSLHMIGKKIDTENIGLQNHFAPNFSVCKIITENHCASSIQQRNKYY